MRIFEFAFNPKKSKNRFFEVYSYEAKSAKEKPRGSLYVVGELQHALEFHNRFLRTLSEVIQQEYYGSSLKTAEAALRAALKKANSFLQEQTKEGNVDWLGNLHVAVLLFITVSEKKKVLHLAKTGTLKVYLNRQGSLVDVGKNLESQGILSPGKVFGNIVSGQLQPGDTLTALTKELHDFFAKERSLETLTLLKEARGLKEFFGRRQRIVRQLSGLVFHALIEEVQALHLFGPKGAGQAAKRKALGTGLVLPRPRLMLPKRIPYKLPSFSFNLPFMRHPSAVKKKLALVGFLVLLLLLGFVLFQGERRAISREARETKETIQQLRQEASSALIFQDEELANTRLQEAFLLAKEHAKAESPLSGEFLALQDELYQELAPLNKLEKLEEPKTVVEVSSQETTLIPQHMLFLGDTLYLYNSFASQLFAFNVNDQSQEVRSAPRNLRLGTVGQDSLIFFAEPNLLLRTQQGETWEEVAITLPSPGFAPNAMESFERSVYLFDAKEGSVARYPDPFAGKTTPRAWMSEGASRKPVDALSFAIDGNIWFLQGTQVHRYFTGAFQESVRFSLFPLLAKPTALLTAPDVPYLFVLEPGERRVVVLTKFGELVGQYQSSRFNDILAAAFTEKGETLYVLSGNTVFAIENIGE